MKKGLIIKLVITVVVIAGLLLMPYGMGGLVEKHYLAFINASSSAKVQLKVVNYQRGWFSSNATLLVSAQANNSPANSGNNPWQFSVQQRIYHGPLIIIDNARGEKRLLIGQAYIVGSLDQPYPLRTTTLITLAGNLRTDVSSSLLTYHLPQLALTIKNLQIHSDASKDLAKLSGHGSAEEITVNTDTSQQIAKNFTVNFHLQKSASGLYSGKRQLHVISDVWSDKSGHAVMLQGLKLNLDSSEHQNKFDSTFDVALNKVSYQGADYGPHALTLVVKNVDIPSLLAAEQQLTQLKAVNNPSDDQLFAYKQTVLNLISKGFTVDLTKLDLATPWGRPSVVANVTLPEQVTPTINPMAIFANANISTNIVVPATLLTKALVTFYGWMGLVPPNNNNKPEQFVQQQIDQWVKENFLIVAGDQYKFNLVYQNQQVKINGQSMAAKTVTVPINTLEPVKTPTSGQH